MAMMDSRDIDIRIARALGFKVINGALYAPEPNPTLIGGNSQVHFGAVSETPEMIDDVWRSYTPHFSSNMVDAFWLLEHVWQRYGIEYNLFRDNGDWHNCEVGYFTETVEYWQESEKSPALAIAKAVAQCPVVMGEDVDAD